MKNAIMLWANWPFAQLYRYDVVLGALGNRINCIFYTFEYFSCRVASSGVYVASSAVVAAILKCHVGHYEKVVFFCGWVFSVRGDPLKPDFS